METCKCCGGASYVKPVREVKPRSDGGSIRELTTVERETWYKKKLLTSKYDPHQGTREKDRRVRKEMF